MLRLRLNFPSVLSQSVPLFCELVHLDLYFVVVANEVHCLLLNSEFGVMHRPDHLGLCSFPPKLVCLPSYSACRHLTVTEETFNLLKFGVEDPLDSFLHFSLCKNSLLNVLAELLDFTGVVSNKLQVLFDLDFLSGEFFIVLEN